MCATANTLPHLTQYIHAMHRSRGSLESRHVIRSGTHRSKIAGNRRKGQSAKATMRSEVPRWHEQQQTCCTAERKAKRTATNTSTRLRPRPFGPCARRLGKQEAPNTLLYTPCRHTAWPHPHHRPRLPSACGSHKRTVEESIAAPTAHNRSEKRLGDGGRAKRAVPHAAKEELTRSLGNPPLAVGHLLSEARNRPRGIAREEGELRTRASRG